MVAHINESQKFIGFVSKYANSTGIIETELIAAIRNPQIVIAPNVSRHAKFIGEGKEWHRTLEEAVHRANQLKSKRVDALRRQLNNLEKGTVPVVKK